MYSWNSVIWKPWEEFPKKSFNPTMWHINQCINSPFDPQCIVSFSLTQSLDENSPSSFFFTNIRSAVDALDLDSGSRWREEKTLKEDQFIT